METSDIIIVSATGAAPICKSLGVGDIAPVPPIEYTLDGRAIGWPVDPNALYLLYAASGDHQRCCQIKAECAFGNGVSPADELKSFLPDGTGPASFFVRLGLDLEIYGNAFAEIVRAGKRIVGLKALPARTMMVLKDKAGFVQWIYEVDGHLREVLFRPDEILHLRAPCSAGFHYSLPSWVGGQNMIELTAAATAYNAAFFRNRAIPDYAIITKQGMLSDTAKAKIQDFFRGEFAGADNAHRALYIPAGAGAEVEFKKLTEDRKDADFLKLLDAARERIVTAHGVPPRMLGIVPAGQLGGGGEVAEQLKVFEVTSLRPKRRRMAEQWEIACGEMGLGELEFAPLDLEPKKPEAPPLPPAEPAPPAEPEAPEPPEKPEEAGEGEDVMKTADLVALLWKDA